jgi:hypothetical protein
MNTQPNYFKPIARNLSDDCLQEIYTNILKIKPLQVFLEDKFCIAIVNEWHFRRDPKH